jgi:hypothetical protein
MKAPKNRKKAFRVDCANCHATQDSLQFACNQCRKPLYANMEADEMSAIAEHVASMELALTQIESPIQDKSKPYAAVDEAWATYKGLGKYAYLPGMKAYLDRVLEVLLPIKLRLLQRTAKANWIFLAVLLAFPMVTALFRMPFSISGLLLLPAVAWTWIAFKASQDVKRTRLRIAQIKES